MSKDSCRFHTGNTQWSMWVCLLTWDCLSHYSFHNMAYKKMFNLVKLGVELKMNWLNGSIPISSGFQFQFNSNSKSLNSNPIQFMLNWIELIINSNSIHELIRALDLTLLSPVHLYQSYLCSPVSCVCHCCYLYWLSPCLMTSWGVTMWLQTATHVISLTESTPLPHVTIQCAAFVCLMLGFVTGCYK